MWKTPPRKKTEGYNKDMTKRIIAFKNKKADDKIIIDQKTKT